MDFISSLPEKFWIIIFTTAFIIILISSILILYLSMSPGREKTRRDDEHDNDGGENETRV